MFKDFHRVTFTLGIKVTCYPDDMEINIFRTDYKICLFNNSGFNERARMIVNGIKLTPDLLYLWKKSLIIVRFIFVDRVISSINEPITIRK